LRIELRAEALAHAFVMPGSGEEAAYRRAVEGEDELVTSPTILMDFATLLEHLGWDPVMAEDAVVHVARVAAEVTGRRRDARA
jgi:hypothetical protein